MSVKDTSRIVIDCLRVMLKIVISLIDYSSGIIYDRNMFKVLPQFYTIIIAAISSAYSTGITYDNYILMIVVCL